MILMIGLFQLSLSLVSCKSMRLQQTAAELSALKGATHQSPQINWSTNSELTSASIVTKECTIDNCISDPKYELGLEKEYWRHVHREDYAGMEAWQKKAKDYTKYSSERSTRVKQIARLTKLMAFGGGMMLLKYDLHEMVPDLNAILKAKDIQSVDKELKRTLSHPGIGHLMKALGSAIVANKLAPEDTNAQTVLLVIGTFAQAVLPPNFPGFEGLTGIQAYKNTIFGPSCRDITPENQQNIFGGLCFKNGLMGPGGEAYKSCVDKESCSKVGTGTEGLLSGAMSLVMLHNQVGAEHALTMLGDGPGDDQIALCDSYWCSFNNYNNPNAPLPEATAIAPFKKIGSLLSIAEAYGKVGNLNKMERVLKSLRMEAKRLNYPYMQHIERVESSLKGGDSGLGIPDMLKTWKNPQHSKDILGAVQFPLPMSGRSGNCVSCHYGGVLSSNFKY